MGRSLRRLVYCLIGLALVLPIAYVVVPEAKFATVVWTTCTCLVVVVIVGTAYDRWLLRRNRRDRGHHESAGESR